MIRIAIIGAGFSGLGLCYHLLKEEGKKEVTVFDQQGVGGGASGIASGLLHPFPGENARLSWKGREGLAATLKLLTLVGPEVYKKTGILRLALNKKQIKAFKERAEQEKDVEWLSADKCHQNILGGRPLPGIFIKSGVTVHAPLYLKGLWEVCKNLGAHFELKNVELEMLKGFDQVVIAAGAGLNRFNLGLNIKINKGQILTCRKPNYWSLKSSLIGKGYLALSANEKECFLGSTYEHEFQSTEPCLGTAIDLIFPQLDRYLPNHGSFEVLGCRSGLRVTNRNDYRPIIGEIKQGLFVITGMGSRGLLYHSYFGSILARQMRASVLQGLR